MTARRWDHAAGTLEGLIVALPLWITRARADGWPTHTPGAGLPGGGGGPGSISDRTGEQALRRSDEDT